jgi:hypothetical protein
MSRCKNKVGRPRSDSAITRRQVDGCAAQAEGAGRHQAIRGRIAERRLLDRPEIAACGRGVGETVERKLAGGLVDDESILPTRPVGRDLETEMIVTGQAELGPARIVIRKEPGPLRR